MALINGTACQQLTYIPGMKLITVSRITQNKISNCNQNLINKLYPAPLFFVYLLFGQCVKDSSYHPIIFFKMSFPWFPALSFNFSSEQNHPPSICFFFFFQDFSPNIYSFLCWSIFSSHPQLLTLSSVSSETLKDFEQLPICPQPHFPHCKVILEFNLQFHLTAIITS